MLCLGLLQEKILGIKFFVVELLLPQIIERHVGLDRHQNLLLNWELLKRRLMKQCFG